MLDASIDGRNAIREAAVRLGGIDALRGIARIRHVSAGTVSDGLQAFDPAHVEAPDASRQFTRRWDLDLASKRHRRETSLSWDGATLRFIDVYAGGRYQTRNPDLRVVWGDEASTDAYLTSVARYFPPLLIARAIENVSSAIRVGESGAGGVRADVVEFSWDAATRLRVHLACDDRRVLRLEAAAADPLIGDDTAVYDFAGEVVAGGVAFPTRLVYRRRGSIVAEARVERVEVNPAFDEEDFAAPVGYEELAPAGQARRIGADAYEMVVGNGPNNVVQFFDLGDVVVVYDALLSDDTSRMVAEQIEATLGKKPIGFVVASHFHDDHVGGIGYYAALGARIVATEENAPVLRRFANARSRLNGAVPGPATDVRFLLAGHDPLHIAGSNGRSVTVYRVDDLPHVSTMLLLYHPLSRTIAEADLYDEYAPLDRSSLKFAAWLRRPDAPPVDRIAGTHHRAVDLAVFLEKADAAALTPAR